MRPVGEVDSALFVMGSGANESGASSSSDRPERRVTNDADVYVGPRSTQIRDGSQATREQVELPGDRAILLYNSDCSVCRKISSWVTANDEPSAGGDQRIDERPIGYDPEALKKVHPELDIWAAYETIHVVMPDGQIKKGGEAVAEVLRRLPDTRWFSGLFDVDILGWRPFQSALNVGYAILDRIRPALGCESCGTPPPWWAKPIEWAVQAWRWLAGSKP